MRNTGRRIAVWLGLTVLSVYLFLAAGYIDGSDGEQQFQGEKRSIQNGSCMDRGDSLSVLSEGSSGTVLLP